MAATAPNIKVPQPASHMLHDRMLRSADPAAFEAMPSESATRLIPADHGADQPAKVRKPIALIEPRPSEIHATGRKTACFGAAGSEGVGLR